MHRSPFFAMGARASSPVLALLVFALPVFAQPKHPFTFEDMMALKRVEGPQPSPDGKWVLFAAVDVDLKANTKTPHVWVVPLNTQVSQKQGDLGHPNSDQLSNSRKAQTGDTQTGVPHVSPGLRDMGNSNPDKEREIISDQDADRPRWAPDGKHFAFVSSKENGSQIWIADFDSATGTVTAKHRLTYIATEADGELWSPDGKNILFKSDVYPECDGAPAEEGACNAKKVQEGKDLKVKALVFTRLLYRHWNAYREGKRTHLFVISTAEVSNAHVILQNLARDLTPGDYDAPVFSLGGQDDYAFSPDGQEICYASNHDPEPAISTNNDLFTVPVNVGTAAKLALSGVEGAARSGESGQDSVELRSTRQPGAVATRDLKNGYVAQVLAQTKDITAENKAADNTPLYSPDGKYIAYRAQQRPGYESDRFRLMLYDRKTGEKKNLTEKFDGWVGSFTWAGNNGLLFAAEAKGVAPILYVGTFSLANQPYEPREIVDGFNDDLIPGGGGLLFTRMSIEKPDEIYRAKLLFSLGCGDPAPGTVSHVSGNCTSGVGLDDSQGEPPAQISYLNDTALSQVLMSPLETFWFTGANNDQVQGFLVKPPNFDPNKKYPVKFLIHGGPQGAWGDDWSYRWNPELFAANGYVVIMINFHGSTGYGQKFIDAINGDWGGAPFEDLMKGLDYAEQHYSFIDKGRECALGASYGGYMANWVLGHTNRFKCIVSHDGMFNTESAWGTTEELWFNEWEFKGAPYTNREMYRKWSPHLSATSFKTPTLVIHGQLDYRLDVSQGFDLFTTLQRQGVPSKMLYFPDEGHWVLKPQNSQLWYKTVNDWVDQWIGKGK